VDDLKEYMMRTIEPTPTSTAVAEAIMESSKLLQGGKKAKALSSIEALLKSERCLELVRAVTKRLDQGSS
jgi:hypothetical protein